MGSRESTTRKVSFGVDDEDRVRILRGIKLSEDVLQRMRGVANIAPGSATGSHKDAGTSSHSSVGSQAQHSSHSNKPTTDAKKEPRRSQHSTSKDDLSQRAQREEMSRGMSWERQHIHEEAKKAQQLSPDDIEAMVKQLQKKDSQLKALDAFYREQLAQMEKRNWEKYEEGKEKFHQAASEAEENVRSRNTDPVCSGLQAQILSCYRDNKDHTLKCSGLAKEYLQCINAAKKNLLINHG